MTYEVRNGRVVRTAFSMARAAWRAVKRVPVRKVWIRGVFIEQPITDTKQDHEDSIRERYLSRSKPYPNKGKQEAARRVRQMQT